MTLWLGEPYKEGDRVQSSLRMGRELLENGVSNQERPDVWLKMLLLQAGDAAPPASNELTARSPPQASTEPICYDPNSSVPRRALSEIEPHPDRAGGIIVRGFARFVRNCAFTTWEKSRGIRRRHAARPRPRHHREGSGTVPDPDPNATIEKHSPFCRGLTDALTGILTRVLP